MRFESFFFLLRFFFGTVYGILASIILNFLSSANHDSRHFYSESVPWKSFLWPSIWTEDNKFSYMIFVTSWLNMWSRCIWTKTCANAEETTKTVKQQKKLQCLIVYIFHNVSKCHYVTIIHNVYHRSFMRLWEIFSMLAVRLWE